MTQWWELDPADPAPTYPVLTPECRRPSKPIWPGWASNFNNTRLVFEGYHSTNIEAAFQGAKTLDEIQRARIAMCPDPGRAKVMGRNCTLRPDWEHVKFGIMLDLQRIKYASDPHLARLLEATGGLWIEEINTHGDRCWGTVKGTGNNLLGICLMVVRAERRGDPKAHPDHFFHAIRQMRRTAGLDA